ncbi:hypothetical protein J23TS9_29220 [Paenibacillus sp. J23TS9]|nr:hypothetical protein J23TS9_29220 [Paenibacillus sp. J23TS9]
MRQRMEVLWEKDRKWTYEVKITEERRVNRHELERFANRYNFYYFIFIWSYYYENRLTISAPINISDIAFSYRRVVAAAIYLRL